MSRARLLVAAALLLVLPGCSTVPMTSATVQITQAPARPAGVVGIEPLPPEAGAPPEDIVRSFIDAAASTRLGHPVAREHLTPEAAGSWSDEAGITVIGPDYATVTTEDGAVEVTANIVGTIDPRGVFVVGGNTFTREFALEKVGGEWRIVNPPDGLIILEPDFRRLYEEAAVYFLDPTGQRLVPDPRYLLAGEALPTTIVERLLAGPSAYLPAGAVQNPLDGARLRSSVGVAGQVAVVDLTGVSAEPGPLLAELSAQLVWTLTQLRSVSVQAVEVRIDGEPVAIDGVPDQQTTEHWVGFDPNLVPLESVGLYLADGALRAVSTGAPTPGPAGVGAYGLTEAAVSIDAATGQRSFLVGVRPEGGGSTVLAGPYAGDLVPVLSSARLSSPSVAATRSEVWVVRDSTSVVRVQAGGPPQAVTAPTLPGLGRTEVLKLSPDAVRAALVVEGPGGRVLYVGTVVRAEDGSVALRDFRAIAPQLSRVVDVAWRDSGSLLVLAGGSGQEGIVPYGVGVDGWGLAEIPTAGLPSQPRSIAAVPTRQPLVDAGGTIWQLTGGTWTTLVRGQEPLPGNSPFYPL